MKLVFKFLPKLIILVFALILVNCQQEDETVIKEPQTIQKPDSGLKSRKVTLEQVPNINSFINQKFSSKQRTSSGTDYVITNFGNIPLDNITEVIDTIGNINYSFAILPKRIEQNKFFNFVIY